MKPSLSLLITQDTIPWISEDWTPDNEPSLKGHEYTPSPDEVHAFRNRTNAFYEDGNPVARFTDCFKNKYPVSYEMSPANICLYNTVHTMN